eukprot:gnl/TRDRNA2_/TRDRNA2_83318_c0_seq1.p1 gnl/TRDRNA2_/TRDRNA2_83318_c0~~gnl/TRDRNA2_/TRDRNA2_83318_c0_seq1.p1  ORF type:complete len:406 (+),score=60.96 gnl/TRDRNA2_/TRDRNA2_83318_c0_seq1:52-1218(+)
MVDEEFMLRAVHLAERAKRRTSPNPWVGAVIVAADGKTILGEGFHTGPGCPHAEVEAFRDAEKNGHTDFSDATLYTTLEPCHRGPGKRTPPCDELVVAKKVKRCVVGHVDPCPKHGGAGCGFIRDHSIPVDVGIAEQDVCSSLRAYFHHRSTDRPYVVVKIATSLDGRIACADGSSQWITKVAAREDAHRLRADSQAILIGSGTALKDRPSLTVRLPEDPGLRTQPLRVVLDTRGRVMEGPLLDTKVAPTLMFTSKELCSSKAREVWKERGVDCCDVPLAEPGDASPTTQRLDLRAVLTELASRGVLQLMVEGGAVLQGELLRMGLCEEIRLYLGATLLGSSAQPWAQTPLTSTISDARFWRLRDVRKLKDDVCLEYVRLPEEAKEAK